MKKRIAGGYAAPYAGSGKLSDYRKDGSWMMNQMQKGYDKVERGITVKDSGDGNVRFAKRPVNAALSADGTESWKVSRYCCPAEKSMDGVSFCQVCLCLDGDIDGASLHELETLGGVLYNCLDGDKRSLEECHAWMGECSDARIDFGCRCLCLCCDINFTDENAEQVEACLSRLGYRQDNPEC